MAQNRRRQPGLELGVILLMSEMFNIGFGTIPRVTLFSILGQVLLYLGVINVPWSKYDVCISADAILNHKDYKRFIFSTFEHADDMHLYYNMVSFLIKGRTLENRYGSSNFALLLAFLTLLTNSFYIALAKFGSEFLEDYSMMKSCAIGFSGVLFALKVITTAETGPGTAYIMGIPVPSKYAAWAELVAIHLLVPNASFLGHLAGILAGCAYMSTPIGRVVDSIIANITGWPMFHETGSSYQHHQSYQSSSSHERSSSGFDSAGFQPGSNGRGFGTNNFGFGNGIFGTGFGNGGFGSGFGNGGFGSGFGNGGFGSGFGNGGFGSGFGNGGFGPNLFQRHTPREQEYGWRY
ncbi:rhomboid-related protein 4-like [Macrosteles quadrilineatus]|uniref:rhomboid-related protein 4-like n=1 Tax=Macrosteles quadrilineatus TaxID=74068 RepID=UPI0023E25AD4|nr:rhomboid-related protein 4-like [Macrosteles quadrilineatus]